MLIAALLSQPSKGYDYQYMPLSLTLTLLFFPVHHACSATCIFSNKWSPIQKVIDVTFYSWQPSHLMDKNALVPMLVFKSPPHPVTGTLPSGLTSIISACSSDHCTLSKVLLGLPQAFTELEQWTNNGNALLREGGGGYRRTGIICTNMVASEEKMA